MIAPDSDLVRRLRRGVRTAVAASPALRAERRRVRVGWLRRHFSWGVLRFIAPLLVFGFGFFGDTPARLGACSRSGRP